MNRQEASSTQTRILIIDDEKLVRESIAIYLEDSGYLVLEADDGRKGVELFCEFNPDLVLCDLRMPEIDGLEVLKSISELSPKTPIIIVSGAGQIHDVVEALRLGARDYLVKPVSDLAVLENAVCNALNQQQLEKENQLYRDELEAANSELERNLELLQQDQEAGRRAQLQLLPEPDASLQGYKFRHVIIPSLNLSGDFIDYFSISERYLGFYIADVSGHGAAAAFVTMTLKSLVNQPLRQFRIGENEIVISPSKFLHYLNKELIDANLGKHITIFYGVLDCDSNQLTYSVAGQYPAPVVINNQQVSVLNSCGFPVGLFEWANFENETITVGKNFKLVMVSDGWLELVSEENGPAGEEFLVNYLHTNSITIDNLMKPVRQYPEDNLPDDITVFIITKESQ
ncbi:response regulator [Aliikangiella sp. G2MR2-5]|uniref:response regulator n=1 Tax=Aliikangiella sp. G2MR2-5 TaxID=2788943 RepID=UPI0018AA15BE|nr:response regulator [Aliikangiella sp. G2MR2-5]